MNLSFDRFKKTNTENSITSAVKYGSAHDTNNPFSLIEWIANSNLDFGSPEQYIQQYSIYLKEWTDKNGSKIKTNNDLVVESYKNLLKEISLKYTTSEEKRYLANLDFDNPLDLDIAIPFFASRLKDIVLFLAKKREDVKFQKTKFSLFGTNEGIEKLLKNLLLQLTSTDEFILGYLESKPELAEISKNTVIQIEEFYDIRDTYFNEDPCNSDNRSIEYDPYIFIDFETAVRNLGNDLGTIIQSSSALDIFTSSDSALTILSDSSDVDFDEFPLSEFFNYVRGRNNLNLIPQKDLVNQLLGNDTSYISAGSLQKDIYGNTTAQYVTGNQATATSPLLNFFNTLYPTINYTPDRSDIYTKRQLGGFFTPQHLGTTSFASIAPSFKIKKEHLDANTIYEIPDPTRYGLSELKIITHDENASWVMADMSNASKSGDIVKSAKLQKMYNYQSVGENNPANEQGVSKVVDGFDFWTGDLRDIWANQDVYSLSKAKNILDHETRQNELLVNKGDIHTWKSDIFGNDFCLFKSTRPNPIATLTPFTTECGASQESVSCWLLDGGSVIDVTTGSSMVHPTTALGGDILTNEYDTLAYGSHINITHCDDFNAFLNITNICHTLEGEELPIDFTSDNIALSGSVGTGFAATEVVDTVWNCYYFTFTQCDYTPTNLIETLNTPFLSASLDDINSTSLVPYTTPISHRKSIYNQRNGSLGELWIRNINNTIISPASAAISGIYNKYQSTAPTVQAELKRGIYGMDVIYDTLILTTENYQIFETIDYNFKTNLFSAGHSTNYIQTNRSNLEKCIHHFFNEQTDKIYTGYTREVEYSNNTGVLVYPEIYEYDLKQSTLKKVFPSTQDDLTTFRIPDELTNISTNTDTVYEMVDHPIITYNELTDRYYITASCALSSKASATTTNQRNMFGVMQNEFKLFDGKFEHVDSVLYFPPNSGYDQDAQSSQSTTVDLENGIYTTSIGPISSYDYTLNVNPAGLSDNASRYIKFVYDFGDGSDMQVISRPAVDDNILITTLNVTDPTNPKFITNSHTYFFTGSAAETITVRVSAITYTYNVEEYTINLNRQPYTLASAFSGLKLIECKSYMDNNYNENTLLTLESQNPTYVTHLNLKGKQYNKTTFTY